MIKTPAEARKLLVTALRSGEYKQGIKRLEIIDKDGQVRNCCLGVACRLYMKNGGVLETRVVEEYADSSCIDFRDGEDGTRTDLPTVVQDWLGFTDPSGRLKPRFTEGSFSQTLAMFNDTGKTFEQIADIIEKEGVEVHE